LEYVKGIKVKPTLEINKGREIHNALEKEHKKKAKFKLSIIEAIKKSQKEKITLVGREIRLLAIICMDLLMRYISCLIRL